MRDAARQLQVLVKNVKMLLYIITCGCAFMLECNSSSEWLTAMLIWLHIQALKCEARLTAVQWLRYFVHHRKKDTSCSQNRALWCCYTVNTPGCFTKALRTTLKKRWMWKNPRQPSHRAFEVKQLVFVWQWSCVEQFDVCWAAWSYVQNTQCFFHCRKLFEMPDY